MSDDIPRARRDEAEASAPDAGEVPAGGSGADTGAVGSARIDDADRAAVQNISSQNDIAGVGTRAGDGSMEAGTARTARTSRGSAAADGGTTRRRADAEHSAPSLAQQYEPGVDGGHARESRALGPEASAGDPGSVDDRPDGTVGRAAERAGSRGLLLLAGIVGVIAIVMFAIAIPVAPAVAWIGIALEVALLALIGVSAFALRAGHYRSLSILVPTIAVVAVAVIFTAALLVIGLAR